MQINPGNLRTLHTAFKANFQRGLGQAPALSNRIATEVPSSTRENEYGWMGKIPNVREWIGDRVVNNIAASEYSIKNRPWELTIGVDRDDIDDDNIGIYAPLFQEMGASTVGHREMLCWGLLKAGFSSVCYDGQNYFDAEHPVLDENGGEILVANTDGGAGRPWFLIDDSRALKPIIFQKRRDWTFVARDNPDDPNVFDKKEFKYGVDARHNVGFGFWQFAWGSKQALDATNYAEARAALSGMKGDYGRPLGLTPKLLVVGPADESAGLELLNAERNAAGATNVYRNTAELLVVPWLA